MGIMLACFVYFSIQDYLNTFGVYPFVGAKFIHDYSATLLLPLAHLFICYSMGIVRDLRFFKLLMLLTALEIPDLTGVLAHLTSTEPLESSRIFNYVHFEFFGGSSFNMQLYSVVILLQVAIEVQRTMVMRRIFVFRDLYLKPGAKFVVWLAAFTCLWIFVTILPPITFYAVPLYNVILMGSYSFIITALVLGIVHFFNNDIVVDRENKPVQIDNDVDSQLADDISLMLERDKIYLNPTLRIEQMASMLSTNRTYITRAFRLKFQSSFTEVMNHYRVEHAKEIMRENPKKRIEEVALESGFSSSNFFGRTFKQVVGVTPSQWRIDERNGLHDGEVAAPVVKKKGTGKWMVSEKGMTTEEALGLEHGRSKKSADDAQE